MTISTTDIKLRTPERLANVAAILATLRARDSVRLGSADAVNGIAYLVAAGLLTQQRGAEVLHYT